MKTSTMLIIAAIVVTLGCLTAFNYKIKDQYTSGSYKSRFRGMEFTPLSGLEKLNLQAANRIAFTIEQGEKEGIWIRSAIKDKVKFDAGHQTLHVDLTDLGKSSGFYASNGDIIIFTKKLSGVIAAPYFKDSVSAKRPSYYNVETTLAGYNLNQLEVEIGKSISVNVRRSAIKNLTANIGNKMDGGAGLIISSDTKIDTARLNVPGKSTLTLLDAKIVKTVYNLADSATVTLNGNLVQLINQEHK
jgi:hypothetical protein